MPLKSKLKSPLSVYKHYENEQGDLYDPRDMQEFADKHSPGLRNRVTLTSKQADLQKRRIVALLHIPTYYR